MSGSPFGSLAGRRVVLGVCGGIAAYKAVELCRLLVDAGSHVSPVLTTGATRFVGEATFSALASEPARTSLWESPEPIPHTKLGQGADLIVVAPATARLIGAYAAGISSDLLTATLLATRAQVVICPAMHTEMWEHPAVQDNLALLAKRGVQIVPPGEGRLAGGDLGSGRLAEPHQIAAVLNRVLDRTAELAGLKALVSAGGTREPIDPVRFIGNRSSGRQGHAVAAELARRGAEVTLVTASSLDVPVVEKVEKVTTAAEMAQAVRTHASAADVIVMAAAVADFTPANPSTLKIKKQDGPPKVELIPTLDILAAVAEDRRPGQIIVGFAAETAEGDALVSAARSKLLAKKLDIVVGNDISSAEAGFDSELNAAVIVDASSSERVPLTSKAEVAACIVDRIVVLRSSQATH